jgi:hypothetical protein
MEGADPRQLRLIAPPAEPFAAALAGLDEAALTALLERRPDLASPPPRDLGEVLARASRPVSVSRATDHLDVVAITCVRALLTLDGAGRPEDVAKLVGAPLDPSATAGALARAAQLLLAVEASPGVWRAHPALSEVLRVPRLGPRLATALDRLTIEELRWIARYTAPALRATRKVELVAALAAELGDPDRIRAKLAEAPEEAAELARRLAREGRPLELSGFSPYPRYEPAGRDPRGPVEWLAWHGLLVKQDWYSCVVPREVALVLTGGRLFEPVPVERPTLDATAPPAAAATDAGGLAAAAELVAEVEAVVEVLAAAPTKMLKTGGLGIRELRRLAKGAGLPEARLALVLELAMIAGLVGEMPEGHEGGAEALPTVAYDEWSGLDVDERWKALAATWFVTERYPSLAGTNDADGKVIPALVNWSPRPQPARQRAVVLGRLAELPHGVAPTRESLVQALAWDAPSVAGAGPRASVAATVGWVLAEASVLGLVHGDALSVLGRNLLTGDMAAARAALAAHAGRASTRLVLQADLTAIVESGAPLAFRDRLGLVADVESKGAATVYRFSESSLGRGFDAGLTVPDVLGFLGEHATKGVPQPLAYLVEDAARRHGRVRVGSARSYVRCADEPTAAELLRHRRAAKLGLRALAPAVLVSDLPPESLLGELRAAGYLPAHEDATGGLVVSRRPRRRAKTPAVARAAMTSAARETARRLLTGAAAAVVPEHPKVVPLGVEYDDVGFDLDDLRRGGERGLAGVLAFVRPQSAPVVAEDDAWEQDDVLEPCDCERPVDIARDPVAIHQQLDLACDHEWAVRLSLPDPHGGDSDPLHAEVLLVGADAATIWIYDDDSEREVRLSDVAWARVLTLAEEEALLDDPPWERP